MELTDTQKEAVAAWFAAGASLDEIQKRIKSEFGVHLTYLDVRLLVAELPQPEETGEVADEGAKTPMTKPSESDQAFADGPGNHPKHEPCNQQEEGEEVPLPEGDANTEAQTVSAPTVTIDALMIPGTIASGDVTFSDGKTGKWYLDQMGRLGIGNLPEGYRPSPTDAALFQQQLMGLLQARGLC